MTDLEALARYERAMDAALSLVTSHERRLTRACQLAAAAYVERILADHDLLLRRLGQWPTSERWADDRPSALEAVRRQLVEVVRRTDEGERSSPVAHAVAELADEISRPAMAMAT